MTNITLTEKEIKILLMEVLKKAGVEVDEIVFKQKVQFFGKDRGIEISAELIKNQSADDVSSLLNKLTYQNQNQFIPIPQTQQPAPQPFINAQVINPVQTNQQQFGTPVHHTGNPSEFE